MEDLRPENETVNTAVCSGGPAARAEDPSDYASAYDYSPLRGNIVIWSDVGGRILEIGGERGALTGVLLEKGAVTSVEADEERAAVIRGRFPGATVVTDLSDAGDGFDCAVLIGSLEDYAKGDEVGFLNRVCEKLKPEGKLVIAVDNSLAAGRLSGRAAETYARRGYSLAEFKAILGGAGLKYSSLLYPAPDYRFTNVIFSDRQLPDGESIKRRLTYSPSQPTATFNENAYLRKMIETDPQAYPTVADAFLVAASRAEAPETPKLVCFSVYRKPEYRIYTVVGDGCARKYAAEPAARGHIESVGRNVAELREIGVETPDSYSGGVVTSRICSGETFDKVLLAAYETGGADAFKKAADGFFAAVAAVCGEGESDNTVFEKFSVPLTSEQRGSLRFLKRGYMDMIFQNCFFEDGRYVFYDQEWRFVNTPLEYIIFRALTNSEVIAETVREDLFELFGIAAYKKLFAELNRAFADEVYSELYKKWFAVEYATPGERISSLTGELEKTAAANESLTGELEKTAAENDAIGNRLKAADEKIAGLQGELEAMRNRRFGRRCVNFMHAHPALHKFIKIILAPVNFVRCKIKQKRGARFKTPAGAQDAYSLWIKNNRPGKAELEEQRKREFGVRPVFSILTPLYNTDKKMLEEMIGSVTAQTYSGWELCLADASDGKHSYVREVAEKFAAADGRVKYRRLDRNLGIAGNTNAAASLASGDYIALLDHDDMLAPDALYELAAAVNAEPDADFLYTDEDKFSGDVSKRFDPHFKPDFSIYTLRSFNYICHFTALKRTLFDEIGGYLEGYDGAQDYDLFLRAAERAKLIKHIPEPLYHWRVHPGSTAASAGSKNYAEEAGRKAVEAHLRRVGVEGEVLTTDLPFRYRVRYALTEKPLVSVLIPNKDSAEDLKKCVNSVLACDYGNFEIIIIENNSETDGIFALYDELEKNEKIRVVRYRESGFNYSKINNYGASFARGELLLLLNNDIEAIKPDWLGEMVSICILKDVIAVGARLLYPDDTVQHSGVIVGAGGVAGHMEKEIPADADGYFGYGRSIREYSAVTAACMLVRHSVFDAVGGLDPGFAVAFNDIDFCLRIKETGGKIVYTPFAVLHHYESKSRGLEDSPEKIERFRSEIERFRMKWSGILENGDPFFNKNLSLYSNFYEPKLKK